MITFSLCDAREVNRFTTRSLLRGSSLQEVCQRLFLSNIQHLLTNLSNWCTIIHEKGNKGDNGRG